MKSMKILLAGLLLGFANLAFARTIEMDVNGLVCAFCAQGIEKSLKALPETQAVYVSLERRLVAVQLKDGADIDDALLRKTITNAGYKIVAIRRSDASLEDIRKRVADHE